MTVNEADRRRVHNKLAEIAGETEANLIMEMFPKPDLVAQISETRAELHIEIAGLRNEMNTKFGELRNEMNTKIGELRNEMNTKIGDLRNEMLVGFANIETRFEQQRVEIQQGFRTQTMTMFVTMLTLAGVIVAAFAAFH